jgi:hypothetical protein
LKLLSTAAKLKPVTGAAIKTIRMSTIYILHLKLLGRLKGGAWNMKQGMERNNTEHIMEDFK